MNKRLAKDRKSLETKVTNRTGQVTHSPLSILTATVVASSGRLIPCSSALITFPKAPSPRDSPMMSLARGNSQSASRGSSYSEMLVISEPRRDLDWQCSILMVGTKRGSCEASEFWRSTMTCRRVALSGTGLMCMYAIHPFCAYWTDRGKIFTVQQRGITSQLTFLIQCWVMALARSNSMARLFSFCHFFHTNEATMLPITNTESSTPVSTMMAWYSASRRMGSAGVVVKSGGEIQVMTEMVSGDVHESLELCHKWEKGSNNNNRLFSLLSFNQGRKIDWHPTFTPLSTIQLNFYAVEWNYQTLKLNGVNIWETE